MKTIFTIIAAICLSTTSILAQTPAQFKYQAVLRDADGQILTSPADITIKIYDVITGGVALYAETHPGVIPNDWGVINLNIGSLESLDGINWSNGTYFIGITIGTGEELGRSQLLSVPYALMSKEVENVDYSQISNTPFIPTDLSDLTDNTYLLFSGNYNDLTNLPNLFDGQYGSLSGLPTLFSGSFTDLSNKPTTIAGYGITDAFSGNYNDLTNKPTIVTTTTDGFMSSTDKTKLNGLENINITAGTGISVTGTYPDITITNTVSGGTHYVGELYGGGVVFWVDHTGQHGLIVSMIDLSTAQAWSNLTTLIGATAQSDWDGNSNTTAITGQSGHTSSAAKLCADYTNTDYGTGTFSDWYLPSRGELNDLLNNFKAVQKALDSDSNGSTTTISKELYWSSTEFLNTDAWNFSFTFGTTGPGYKINTFYVRAVRAF